ncbi:MAG: pitrilysin family protein [Thermodesulfovibrionales bacterium]
MTKMKTKNIAVAAVLFLLLLVPRAVLALNVQEFTLENGLKILVLEEHKAPTATFQVWYRVGSRDEQSGKTGLSHLLEHMMFKGTKNHGPKTFSQSIQRIGGIDNAFTSREYTGYFELIAADRIDVAIELEADRMQNLVLTPGSVLSERDVVMEERRLRYDDDPQNMVFEEVMASAFKNHPYAWPVVGWMSDLKGMHPDDLVQHYRTYYAPNNAVVIVVGDVVAAEVVEKIKKAFGGIPRGPEIRRLAFEEPEQKGERRIFVKKEAELPYFFAGYKVPNIAHEDGFALEVLGTILSDGKSSRLYRSLVYEKQLAVSAWAGYDGMTRDPFLFMTGATAAQGRKIEDVEQAMIEEFEKIGQEPPTEQEVQKAKNQIEAAFIMEQDSIYMQAKTIGSFEMTFGWKFIERYLEGVRKVTPEDVRRAAEKYLVADRRTTGVLIPLKNGEKP